MFALHLHAKIPLDFSSGIFLYEICSCATEIDLCESQFMEFQYRERYSPVQLLTQDAYIDGTKFQYRKRYSPVQPSNTVVLTMANKFQYRKRYSPVQLLTQDAYIDGTKFQYRKRYSPVQRREFASTPRQALFQYRKRYSPVQLREALKMPALCRVSIPQAVFACATLVSMLS